MTEHFSKIEDETFPSFLGESVNSSETLENCTLSSNLGLPVAASTIAKARKDFDRCLDTQASYLENCAILPSASIHRRSGENSKGKYVQSFNNEDMDFFTGLSNANTPPIKPGSSENAPKERTVHSQDTSIGFPAGNEKADFPAFASDACSLSVEHQDAKINDVPNLYKDMRRQSQDLLNDDFSVSVASFLANEKLLSIASLDDSSSDDLDDEEFYDGQLEAYFNKLLPGMQRGVIEGQETSEPNRGYQMVGQHGRPSFRPCLEGGNSEDESSNGVQTVPNSSGSLICLQSDGQERCSPRTSPVPGYLSSVKEDSVKGEIANLTQPHTKATVSLGSAGRYVAGEEITTMFQDLSLKQDDIKNCELSCDLSSGQKLDRLYFEKGDMTLLQSVAEKESHNSIHLSRVFSSIGKDGCDKKSESIRRINATLADGKGVNCLSDAYLSPTFERSRNDTSPPWQSTQAQPFLWSFGPSNDGEGGSAPHSVVYQNEEGKWVTDLAYYKSFDNEIPSFSGEVLNEEDFVEGGNALAMIEEDQEEFEREHKFIQEEKMDLENLSLNMGDTSWKLPTSGNVLLRASQVAPDLLQEDASYLRLSLGEFFGQRSEALGCLGGGDGVKRPSFGYHIISPDKQEPFALLRTSDLSGNSEQDETIKSFEDTLTQEQYESLPDEQKLASTTFDVKMKQNSTALDKTVKDPQMDKSNIEVKDCVSEEVKIQSSESMLLSISTIAAAIANASTNADPSQLAAMIMALSNKNRNSNLLELGNHTPRNQSVFSSLEKENCEGAIDMERYLKATEVTCQEGETNVFLDSLKDFTWDMSLRLKHTLKSSVADLSNTVATEKQNLKTIDNSEEFKENFALQSVSGICRPEQDESSEDTLSYRNAPSKLRTVMLNSTDVLGSNQMEYRTNKVSKIPGSNSFAAEEQDLKDSSLLTAASTQLTRTSDGKEKLDIKASNECYGGSDKLENAENFSSNFTGCVKTLRSPRKSSSCVSATAKEPKHCEEASQKHVSFQPPSYKQMSQDTDNAVHGLEEEQYSFRPSTSPLIHSSPSQDSLKLSDHGGEEFLHTTTAAQNPVCVSSSRESSCYSPSMSRLTYVSTMENSFENVSIKSLENKSNNTIELSTTIVRSSPTPEMQLIKPANMSWQQNVNQKSGYSPNQKSNDPSGYSTAASIIINNKSEELLSLHKNNLELKDHSLKYKEKMKEVSSGISNDAYNYFIMPHFQVDTPYTWQEFPTKSREGLPSLNMQSASRLVNYPLMQNISVNHQFVPEPDFKPVVSASDLQKLPSSVPTLFTGQPLSTTQFAHQYLGNVHSLRCSTIPSNQVGNTVLCTGYPGSTAQAQHIQNTITGLTGTSVGSGLLATLPRSQNLPPGNQNIVISASGYPGQFISATGLQHFDTRISSDYGQVLVPEELTFPSACCVGIASQASLNIFNPTDRWLQVNIGVLSVAINGEKVDPSAYQCLVFKNKTIIGPRTAEDLKILFLPQRAGLFQCVLNVSSWPVSADSQTVVRSEALAAKVLLTAVSENPSIEIETGKTGCLDFGDLSSGSWKTLPLKILNKTHATLPIRLIISANATAWRCFTFSKDPSNHSLHMDAMSKMSSPSVLSHVLHASCDGQDSEFLVVWVIFHAPQTYTSTDTLGPAEEFIARVDVEVDSPGPACILKSVPLHARVGCARIHAPKDLQTIHLLCKVGSSSKQILPLKNAGNISVHLKIMASSSSERDFTVNPEELFLVPGEEHVVSVQYTPQHVEPKKSVLKIMVQPSGPQYEVMLVGETEIPTSKNPITATADVPPILSNKQFVAWGGVALGRTVQQKLILRNTSTTSSQYLRLLIKGQDQDCFQLQSTFGHEERLIKNREVTIRPKEDASIHLMFSPTRVSCMLAKLEIKQSGIKSSQPGIKFTIPLSGYGGTSNIILEDVKKLADSYTVTVNGFSSGITSKVSFLIRNTGSRAAYVKAVCFADIYNNVKNDSNMLSVSPEKFVLKERSQEMITLFCKPRKREIALQNSSSLICTVCFFCGDEIARQQFRRSLLHKPESANRIIAENAILKNTRFDEEFSGEQTVSEVYDLPQRPNDIQLFLGNMQKIVLSVTGNDSNANITEEYKSSRQTNSAVENTECNVENTSLDVLPVKGPQGPHLSASEPTWDCVNSQQAWSVQPEHLVLAAPSISGVAETGHVKIINISTKVLQFELSWPAHCLTITPQHGSIEPKSHIIILVSPNPSLATRQTLLPWKGPIYVHCENVHKCIQVQIREDVNPDKSTNDSVPKSVAVVPPHPETSIHKGKSICKSPSKVDIKNRTLIFPKTTSGGSSETFLEIENPGDEEVKWLISSFAPPYVKGVDESGDVYRATYTAFRCSRVSGMLAAHEKLKVAISFFPREKGDYAQFWDLECHPFSESRLKYKLRFQLCGEGIKDETVSGKSSAEIFIKTEAHVKPRQRSGSEASSLKTVQQETSRGVYASEDLYTFPPTFVGDSSTLKVNLQNNSFTTYMLKFVSPKAPFQMKHSKYSLRAHHYINLPVKFKPSSAGRFEDHLVVQTDAGNIPIQFVGEALAK